MHSKRLGPIIIVEDDPDDRDVLLEVFRSLQVPNEIKCFSDGESAYQYLDTTTDKPFIIFSDINMPKMSGAELKMKLNEKAHIRRKSIPFVFLTTTAAHAAVLAAYESLSQGFFTKPNNIAALKDIVQRVLDYWKLARHPNPNLT